MDQPLLPLFYAAVGERITTQNRPWSDAAAADAHAARPADAARIQRRLAIGRQLIGVTLQAFLAGAAALVAGAILGQLGGAGLAQAAMPLAASRLLRGRGCRRAWVGGVLLLLDRLLVAGRQCYERHKRCNPRSVHRGLRHAHDKRARARFAPLAWDLFRRKRGCITIPQGRVRTGEQN